MNLALVSDYRMKLSMGQRRGRRERPQLELLFATLKRFSFSVAQQELCCRPQKSVIGQLAVAKKHIVSLLS
jgi:hypothetical protein